MAADKNADTHWAAYQNWIPFWWGRRHLNNSFLLPTWIPQRKGTNTIGCMSSGSGLYPTDACEALVNFLRASQSPHYTCLLSRVTYKVNNDKPWEDKTFLLSGKAVGELTRLDSELRIKGLSSRRSSGRPLRTQARATWWIHCYHEFSDDRKDLKNWDSETPLVPIPSGNSYTCLWMIHFGHCRKSNLGKAGLLMSNWELTDDYIQRKEGEG